MSAHSIRWEFDDGAVTATAVCHEPPGADCRLTSVTCECEHWGEIQRRDDGTIWHHIDYYGDDTYEPVWHEVKPMDDCNICLFINESGCVEELAVRGSRMVLAETPIRPVWLSDDCEWEFAPAVIAPRRLCDATTHPPTPHGEALRAGEVGK